MPETETINGRVFDLRYVPQEKEKFPKRRFTEQDFRINVLEKIRRLGRGDRYDTYLKSREEAKSGSAGGFKSLSELFARRVCGHHNKNVIFILFGEVGSGKSMALLNLALYCAMWMKHLKGGKVSDYFNMSHVSVIDSENLQETLGNMKPNGIYLLDDQGASGFSARSSMTHGNKDISAILQTCRTYNGILLWSAPHSAMLDITASRIAQYYGEVSESFHSEGITMLKVFRLSQSMRDKSIYYVYLTHGNQTAIRFYTRLPPKPLQEAYEKIREVQARVLTKKHQERVEKEQGGHRPVGAAPTFTSSEFKELVGKYVGKPVTISGVAEEIGIQDKTLRAYLKKNGFVWKRSKMKGKMEIIMGETNGR